MIRAIGEEFRRVCRLTFVEPFRERRLGDRRTVGWWADPYLRKGYFAAMPIFVVGAAITIWGAAEGRNFSLFWTVMLPAALICNVVWLAVAAWLRARAS